MVGATSPIYGSSYSIQVGEYTRNIESNQKFIFNEPNIKTGRWYNWIVEGTGTTFLSSNATRLAITPKITNTAGVFGFVDLGPIPDTYDSSNPLYPGLYLYNICVTGNALSTSARTFFVIGEPSLAPEPGLPAGTTAAGYQHDKLLLAMHQRIHTAFKSQDSCETASQQIANASFYELTTRQKEELHLYVGVGSTNTFYINKAPAYHFSMVKL